MILSSSTISAALVCSPRRLMFLPFPLTMAACSYVGITDGNLIKGYIRECITMVKKNRSHLFAEVWCF